MFSNRIIHSIKKQIIKDQKGVALISALGLSMVVLVASLGLILRLTNFSQSIRSQSQKNQTYYTAYSGIEEMREYFWNPPVGSSCIPPFWCGFLGQDLNTDTFGKNIPEYSNITVDITCPISPTEDITCTNPKLVVGGYDTATYYTLHLMDNHDLDPGGLDYTFDNDEVILILATATTTDPSIAVSQMGSSFETRTSIEANIIYDGGDASGYKMGGQLATRESKTQERGVEFSLRQAF